MQIPNALSITALARSTEANSCRFCVKESLITVSFYAIKSESNIPDIPGICGGLWDNIKSFADYIEPGIPTCEDRDGKLYWQFTNGGYCNGGMLEFIWVCCSLYFLVL
jgi:hypothetical protein